jgi:predicted translin family RNA/ssDNA-binding protein
VQEQRHHLTSSKFLWIKPVKKKLKKDLEESGEKEEAEKGLRRIKRKTQEFPDFYRRLTNQNTTTTEETTLFLLLWLDTTTVTPTINYKQ